MLENNTPELNMQYILSFNAWWMNNYVCWLINQSNCVTRHKKLIIDNKQLFYPEQTINYWINAIVLFMFGSL